MESRTLKYGDILEGCREQRNQFITRFRGDSADPTEASVEVTTELAVAQAHDWDWQWAAEHLLTEAGRRQWDDANKEFVKDYQSVMDDLYSAHWEAGKQAQEAFHQQLTDGPKDAFGEPTAESKHQAETVWRTAVEPSQAAIDKAHRTAHTTLNTARAHLWASIYIREGRGK